MILATSDFRVALGNRRDRRHVAAQAALEQWSKAGVVSTWPVLTEVARLFVARANPDQAVAFVDAIARGACAIPDPPDDALRRAHALMRRCRNLPMDLVDDSLVVLAEEPGEGRILSTGMCDFGVYRRKNAQPFANALLC